MAYFYPNPPKLTHLMVPKPTMGFPLWKSNIALLVPKRVPSSTSPKPEARNRSKKRSETAPEPLELGSWIWEGHTPPKKKRPKVDYSLLAAWVEQMESKIEKREGGKEQMRK